MNLNVAPVETANTKTHQNTTTSYMQTPVDQTNMLKSIHNDKELQDEIRSLGTGSFTTNTFNARLQGSVGMRIFKYIQSDKFGQHGESMALIDTITVSFHLA